MSWRWGAVVALFALLAALPAVAGALPARSSSVGAVELLRRVRASASVGWSGYGESRGTLVLPDVRELSDVPGLFGGETRMRGWWRDRSSWRVDTLSLVGETDTAFDGVGTWVWDSGDNRATRIKGLVDVRLPQSADLLAPLLGRRLAGSDDIAVRRLPSRRVAGRSAAGLRLLPRDSARTSIAHVDVWAEPRTGLPLRVEVTGVGQSRPSLTSVLSDLSLHRPSAARTEFVPPLASDIRVTSAPDVAAQVDRFAPFLLPGRLAGTARSDLATSLEGGGVGTYGRGLSSFAVVPVPRDVAGRIIRALDPLDTDGRAEALTPLVQAVVAEVDGRAYLLSGTVPVALLDAVLAQLRADPPPRRDES